LIRVCRPCPVPLGPRALKAPWANQDPWALWASQAHNKKSQHPSIFTTNLVIYYHCTCPMGAPFVCVCVYIRTYIHTYIHTYVHTYIHISQGREVSGGHRAAQPSVKWDLRARLARRRLVLIVRMALGFPGTTKAWRRRVWRFVCVCVSLLSLCLCVSLCVCGCVCRIYIFAYNIYKYVYVLVCVVCVCTLMYVYGACVYVCV
jgi:hypothetical protein